MKNVARSAIEGKPCTDRKCRAMLTLTPDLEVFSIFSEFLSSVGDGSRKAKRNLPMGAIA